MLGALNEMMESKKHNLPIINKLNQMCAKPNVYFALIWVSF